MLRTRENYNTPASWAKLWRFGFQILVQNPKVKGRVGSFTLQILEREAGKVEITVLEPIGSNYLSVKPMASNQIVLQIEKN
jgi:hypothetical protein